MSDDIDWSSVPDRSLLLVDSVPLIGEMWLDRTSADSPVRMVYVHRISSFMYISATLCR